LERIYTGRIVPEGMAGSSTDQSSIPHPRVRVQEEQKMRINAAGRKFQKRPPPVIVLESIIYRV
jgi:hypothetical protein